MSELSNGDIIRADRDRRTAAICYVVWGAFATWVSVGRASAMWMADANLMCSAMCSFLDGSSCTALALWMVPSMFTSRPPHE